MTRLLLIFAFAAVSRSQDLPGVSTAAPTVAVASAPAAAAVQAPEDRVASEWTYLRGETMANNDKLSRAAVDRLDAFVQQHPDSPQAEEALTSLASAYRAQGDYKNAALALLRLIYERPDSKFALTAKSDLLDLADKKLSRYGDALHELAKGSDAPDKAERMAQLLERAVDQLGAPFYEPLVREFRRFEVRFPSYPKYDDFLWSLAQLQEKDGRHTSALVLYEELQAGFPDGPYASQAEFAAGRIYADEVGDYGKALSIFQDLANKYPSSPLLLSAMQRTASILSDRLRQYGLAVETDEKIIAQFPKTDGALHAYKHEAKLLRDRLDKPQDAIEAYKRLADSFGAAEGVDALETAAKIARKDLKDYKQEIALLGKLVQDYPKAEDAPYQAYEIAQVYEDDLNDAAGALTQYLAVAAQYPDSRYGRKAASRAAKLQAAPRKN